MIHRLATAAFAITLIAAAQPTTAPSPPPTDQDDVQGTVEKWIGDFNRGDFPAFVAACAKTAAIVDGFPPYAWTGCFDWITDYQANNRAIAAAHGTLTIGKPVFAEVSGDRAYMTYPVTFADTQKGKPVTYTGSWAIALRKMLDGWTITGSGSAWSDTTLGKTP